MAIENLSDCCKFLDNVYNQIICTVRVYNVLFMLLYLFYVLILCDKHSYANWRLYQVNFVFTVSKQIPFSITCIVKFVI